MAYPLECWRGDGAQLSPLPFQMKTNVAARENQKIKSTNRMHRLLRKMRNRIPSEGNTTSC